MSVQVTVRVKGLKPIAADPAQRRPIVQSISLNFAPKATVQDIANKTWETLNNDYRFNMRFKGLSHVTNVMGGEVGMGVTVNELFPKGTPASERVMTVYQAWIDQPDARAPASAFRPGASKRSAATLTAEEQRELKKMKAEHKDRRASTLEPDVKEDAPPIETSQPAAGSAQVAPNPNDMDEDLYNSTPMKPPATTSHERSQVMVVDSQPPASGLPPLTPGPSSPLHEAKPSSGLDNGPSGAQPDTVDWVPPSSQPRNSQPVQGSLIPVLRTNDRADWPPTQSSALDNHLLQAFPSDVSVANDLEQDTVNARLMSSQRQPFEAQQQTQQSTQHQTQQTAKKKTKKPKPRTGRSIEEPITGWSIEETEKLAEGLRQNWSINKCLKFYELKRSASAARNRRRLLKEKGREFLGLPPAVQTQPSTSPPQTSSSQPQPSSSQLQLSSSPPQPSVSPAQPSSSQPRMSAPQAQLSALRPQPAPQPTTSQRQPTPVSQPQPPLSQSQLVVVRRPQQAVTAIAPVSTPREHDSLDDAEMLVEIAAREKLETLLRPDMDDMELMGILPPLFPNAGPPIAYHYRWGCNKIKLMNASDEERRTKLARRIVGMEKAWREGRWDDPIYQQAPGEGGARISRTPARCPARELDRRPTGYIEGEELSDASASESEMIDGGADVNLTMGEGQSSDDAPTTSVEREPMDGAESTNETAIAVEDAEGDPQPPLHDEPTLSVEIKAKDCEDGANEAAGDAETATTQKQSSPEYAQTLMAQCEAQVESSAESATTAKGLKNIAGQGQSPSDAKPVSEDAVHAGQTPQNADPVLSKHQRRRRNQKEKFEEKKARLAAGIENLAAERAAFEAERAARA